MELVGLIRLLWAHKLAALAGAVASIALGLFSVTAASTESGVASVGVVLDTPRSQLIDAKPLGADTLAWRAALVADLMGSDTLRSELVRELRIAPEKLVVTAPQLLIPSIATPLPEKALDAAASTTEPYVLSIDAPLPLPIIEVDASAPTRDEAARLAQAAVTVMEADAPGATSDPEIQPYVVESAGPVHSAAIVDGPRKLVGAVIAVFLFALWCAVLAIVPAVRRALRRPTAGLHAVAG